MQITDHTGAAILADGDHDVLLGDGDLHDNVVDHGDQQDSLESLCQVWRLSRSDPLPHICSSISNIIHINRGSVHSQDNIWSPISHNIPVQVSFYSDARNISITTALILAFSLLLLISIYLAVKYRRKTVQTEQSECELENLTHDGKKIVAEDSAPPEYHAVMMADRDNLPPDYDDDLVKK